MANSLANKQVLIKIKLFLHLQFSEFWFKFSEEVEFLIVVVSVVSLVVLIFLLLINSLQKSII
uniref:Uncharacterized protein n=1 Tax=Meloidogyne enterolobii TaxID=390850 RepID=A0A6V7V345_MELEN|nr:unnamed protein product [Meloidogyne enterolobii]